MKRIALLVLAGLLLSAVGGVAAPVTPTPTGKEDEMGTVSGFPIERANGGWLGIEIKDNCFRVTFYNAKKKPTPAETPGIVMRWPVRYQPNDERTELVPTDDPAVLGSAYPVRAPHTFILHVILLDPGKKDSDLETYVVNFSA